MIRGLDKDQEADNVVRVHPADVAARIKEHVG